jgi:hypothetical protein
MLCCVVYRVSSGMTAFMVGVDFYPQLPPGKKELFRVDGETKQEVAVKVRLTCYNLRRPREIPVPRGLTSAVDLYLAGKETVAYLRDSEDDRAIMGRPGAWIGSIELCATPEELADAVAGFCERQSWPFPRNLHKNSPDYTSPHPFDWVTWVDSQGWL